MSDSQGMMVSIYGEERRPAGFTRSEDGYLKPNLDPDHDDGETGYLEIVNALEDLDADRTSYRQAARNTPNVTRQTLSNIHQDDERRRWYIDDEEPTDDRVSAALEDIETDTKTLD